MYKTILLSVDLHDEATWQKALPAAVSYCQAFGAHLHLAYVVPELPEGYVQLYVKQFSKEDLEAKAEADMEAFANDNVPGDVAVSPHVEHGSVYRSVLRLAEKVEADLLVMASHRPDVSDYLLGPNAAKVVRHANCSVLVVRD